MIWFFHRCWIALCRDHDPDPCNSGVVPIHHGSCDEVVPKPFPEPGGLAPELCRQYLLLKYPGQLAKAEAFIRQIERAEPGMEGLSWRTFIDTRSPSDEILKPLDRAFQEWSQT